MSIVSKIADCAKAVWNWVVDEAKLFLSWLAKHGIKLYIDGRKSE